MLGTVCCLSSRLESALVLKSVISFPLIPSVREHTGELAICDGGSCKIHLLSPTMQPIQRISLPYVSPNDLPIVAIVPGNRRNEKDNKKLQKKVVGVQKANKNNSAGKLTCQFYFNVFFFLMYFVYRQFSNYA